MSCWRQVRAFAPLSAVPDSQPAEGAGASAEAASHVWAQPSARAETAEQRSQAGPANVEEIERGRAAEGHPRRSTNEDWAGGERGHRRQRRIDGPPVLPLSLRRLFAVLSASPTCSIHLLIPSLSASSHPALPQPPSVGCCDGQRPHCRHPSLPLRLPRQQLTRS